MQIRLTSLLTRTAAPAILALALLAAPTPAAESLAPPTQQELAQAAQGPDMEKLEAMARERIDADGDDPFGWFYLGYALHLQGELDEAILAHAVASQHPQTAPLATYNLACAHALNGNTDQAFKALDKAVSLGVANPAQYQNDTDLASLHTDPRWDKLIAKLGGNASPNTTPDAASSDADNPAKAIHFWVGDWDCYNTDTGNKSGTNSITLRVKGAVVHESWTSVASPYAGESWNHYDPRTKEWVQTWIGSTGAPGHDIAEIRADTTADAEGLLFEGTSVQQSDPATTKKIRMHVYPIADGLVRQVGHEASPDGSSWKKTYDFIYVPKGRDFDMSELSI